jgi:hypothetical protein
MKTITAVSFLGFLVYALPRLGAGILWDGLEEPARVPNASISLEAGASIGIHVSPLYTSGPASLAGYMGMPFRPGILVGVPVLPRLTFSLWHEDTRVA